MQLNSKHTNVITLGGLVKPINASLLVKYRICWYRLSTHPYSLVFGNRFHAAFSNTKMDGERMSSDELRRQLKNCGVSVGPITPTTYPVYVRKLNSLRRGNSRVNQESRRASTGRFTSSTVSPAANLNGFSSDESELSLFKMNSQKAVTEIAFRNRRDILMIKTCIFDHKELGYQRISW